MLFGSQGNVVVEVCLPAPNPAETAVDKHQTAVGEANVLTNAEGYAEKETIMYHIDANLSKSCSFDLTQFVEQMGYDLIDADELESKQHESRVSLSGYEVKADSAPILKLIFSHFGDLAKDCIFPSITSRARLLEKVCTIYQRLDASSFKDIKLHELNSMIEEVNDMEISKVKVGWLHKRLVDIREAREAIEKKQRNVVATQNRKKTLEEYKKELVSHKKELDNHKKELERCKEKVKAVEKKISEEEKALAVEEAEGRKISEMSPNVSTLKTLFEISSLAHGLLE